MSWRISVEHVSRYRYASPASASYDEVRMTPLNEGRQTLLESRLTTEPAAALFSYRDYFGTTVHAFDLHESHQQLVVRSTSLVETAPARPPTSGIGFSELADERLKDELSEYLLPTAYASLDGELAEAAVEIARGHTPAAAVVALCAFVRDSLAYEPGSTIVTTSALEAWNQKSGVCQDFAHLSLALLRAAGIPARYVSGYLHPDGSAGIGAPVSGASHAWIEAYLGEWCSIDPTNGHDVGEQHVMVARGRDYADVAPFRGIYLGGGLEELSVSVDIARLA